MIFKQFDDVCIPIPRTLTDCIVLIKSDMYRYCGYSSRSKIWREVLINPSFAFVFWLRSSSVQWIGYPVAKMIKTLIGRKRGLQISEHTPIGYGFYIAHAFGTIINPSAVIGNNCTISQFTTIGAIEGNAAVIGNNVYIGSSVCIVENIKVGSNSTIGAGAVVVKNVPDNSTVGGVPAKVISYNQPARLINNRFPYEDCICY